MTGTGSVVPSEGAVAVKSGATDYQTATCHLRGFWEPQKTEADGLEPVRYRSLQRWDRASFVCQGRRSSGTTSSLYAPGLCGKPPIVYELLAFPVRFFGIQGIARYCGVQLE